MVSRAVRAPKSTPRSRERIPLDPVRDLQKMMEGGLEPAQVWSFVRTCGHLFLASNAVLKPETAAYQLAQQGLKKMKAGDPEAPLSAISAHDKLTGWRNAAQGAICRPGWFLDPSQAVVVCADQADIEVTMALMRLPAAGQGSDEDPLEAALWVAEELMPPCSGWKFNGTPVVRLASEIGPGDSWREVFLSTRCLELPAPDVLPALRAARVALHVAVVSADGGDAGEEREWRQWSWEEQDMKQDRRLAELTAQLEQQPRDRLDAAREASEAMARMEQQRVKHLARTGILLPVDWRIQALRDLERQHRVIAD
jgi:hypothetical protein